MNSEINICNNCKNRFKGKYCNICGEKKIVDSDFSLKNLLSQAFGTITNLDSRFLQTFKLLIINPGRLSVKFISGIRVPYLKPFQIFIICNFLFFIFLSDTDLFRSPSKWFFTQNVDFFGDTVMGRVEGIMLKKNLSLEQVKVRYDEISSDLSKSLLILLIPFIALVGIIIKPKFRLGKHLIFATHYFSQFLLSTTILFLLSTNIPGSNKWFFLLPIILMSLYYYIISIRFFYQKNIWQSILYGIVGLLIFSVFVGFYRNFVNLLSLSLI